MHVRREDKDNSPVYMLPSAGYYELARQEMLVRLGSAQTPLSFFVAVAAPGDGAWAASAFSHWQEPLHINTSSGVLEDFAFLQTACDGLVLGASTFSWWAAFTSRRAKLVVAPRTILNSSHPKAAEFAVEDYYPSSWTLLDTQP